MANPHRSTIAVDLGGKERLLRFDHNALAEVEDRLKVGGVLDMVELLGRGSSRVARCLLWAGLVHEDPRLTEKEVGSWDFSIGDVAPLIAQALSAAYVIPGQSGNGHAEGNGVRLGVGGTGNESSPLPTGR